jgi:hypothetical protein
MFRALGMKESQRYLRFNYFLDEASFEQILSHVSQLDHSPC